MAANFHFSSRISLIIFLFIRHCRKFPEITQLLRAMFLFSSSWSFFLFWSWRTAVCRVKIHKNEKWIPFGSSWIDKAGKDIFEFRKKFCIILSWLIPWVFLTQTNIVFMNRGIYTYMSNSYCKLCTYFTFIVLSWN